METIYVIASVWLGLAVFAAIVAHHLRISIALVEIIIGVIAAAVVNRWWGAGAFGSDLEWVRFLASFGAVLLTFLAGAELDPKVIRTKWHRGFGGWICWFPGAFFGMCGLCPFYSSLGPSGKLVGRCRALDNFDGGGLCRYA